MTRAELTIDLFGLICLVAIWFAVWVVLP